MSEQHDPRFLPFFGCNHEIIPLPDEWYGGGFNVSAHLGNPLTAQLWEDLVHRAGVNRIWVIKKGDGQWLLGRGDGACTLYLNDKGLLEDIYLVPHKPCWRKHVPSDKPFVTEESLGAAIGHTAGLERINFA